MESESDNAKIVLRAAQATDKGFILNSWLVGNYWGNWFFNQMNQDLYFKVYTEVVSRLLFNPLTRVDVAALSDDPNMILGFAVYNGPTLHWIYVKKDYRSKGIANLLIKDKSIQFVTSTTKAGAAITKKKNLIFNPFQE
jgi:GNAT superfamily N-acetyltransferase